MLLYLSDTLLQTTSVLAKNLANVTYSGPDDRLKYRLWGIPKPAQHHTSQAHRTLFMGLRRTEREADQLFLPSESDYMVFMSDTFIDCYSM
jgi:hypothetical protein